RASCASSSARPTSRTMRARAAISIADSILQTASMTRWVSVAVTTTDHTTFPPILAIRSRKSGRAALPGLLPHLLKAARRLLKIGRKFSEVLHLPQLDGFIFRAGAALGPFDGLFLGLHLDHPVAADDFFRFGKRSISYR